MNDFQEDVTEIHHPELLEVMSLNQKNLKFVIVEYLCPLGYDKWCNSSNKKFENAECVKKHLLNFHKIPRKLQKPRNLLSFTKEAKAIDDLEVKTSSGGKTTKIDGSNDEFQEDVTEIHRPVEVLPLNQKNLKFVIVEYLCPLGYDKWCNSSNKKFENAECVKKHLLNFHKIPRKLQKPRFAPIRRITYKS